MRLLHTSDWHLGHALKDVSREAEHAAFLAWLLEVCAREEPDVVAITGDVFDSAMPPASAERMWFEFLAAVRRPVVAIAGNHDSPARLGAASAVLRELGVYVVAQPAVLELGGMAIAAVPFTRDDPAPVYAQVIDEARRVGRPIVVMGHLYVAGSAPSPSERRVSFGGIEAASQRLFPADVAYAALGHMHKAQRVGRDTIRYAGSPIPLSFDEAAYTHQVLVVDVGEAVRSVAVPRFVELVRVRGRLGEVISELEAMPAIGDTVRPFLEVIVQLERPEPRLRDLLETALDGKHPRMVAFHVEGTGDGGALAERVSARRLAELDPRDVFLQCWAKRHAEPPRAEIVAAFDRLLAALYLGSGVS